MKVLVAVKRVVDYKVQIRVKSDNSGVETQNVKMSVNPPDENAIDCLLYTSPSPRDNGRSRMPSSA